MNNMIEKNYTIQLEEQSDYHDKYKEYFIDKYKMRHSLGPKIIYRMTTNERGSFPSDNYIDEFLINEKLLGFVYFRRDEYNLCDVFMVDLEIEIPDKWYKMDKIYPIEIYTKYK